MADGVMGKPLRFHGAFWLLLAVFAALSAQLTGFEFKDGDSRLYARMAAELAQQPFSEWLSPQWPAHYYKEGLFEEHLAFFFWPMALLGKLGIPEIPAAVFINALYWLAVLWTVNRLAFQLWGNADFSTVASWSWLLSVTGVVYMVRANHETAVALGMALGALCLLRMRNSMLWMLPLALAACWSVAMKGIVGAVFFPSLALVAWFCARDRRSVLGLAVATVAAALFFWAHDVAFEAANGHSFLRAYLDIHLGYADEKEHHSPFHKLSNLAYYLGVCFYWFAPWSLLVLAGLVATVRRKLTEPHRSFILAALGTVLVHVLFFSLFDRRASRYVFGSFPFLAVAAGPLLALVPARMADPMRAFFLKGPWWMLGATLLVLCARLYFHLFHHMFFSFNLSASTN